MSRPMNNISYGDEYRRMMPREFEQYAAQYSGQIEGIGWKLWDTQTYVSGTTTRLQQFFNVRATQDLSNMETAFQLPGQKGFLIRAIRFFIKQEPRAVTPSAATGAQVGAYDNVALLINTGVFELIIGNKQYVLDPLWCLTAGGGASGAMCAATSAGGATIFVDYAQNGTADPRAVNTLSKPIFIPPQLNFSANAFWPAALTLSGGNTTITFLLDGDIIRPVQ